MRVEELIGRHIRARREGQEMTQDQLGQRLGELLGRPWTRQAVSAAERGARAFTAAELVAVAHALGTSVGRLVTPLADVPEVELPSGTKIGRSEMIAAAWPDLSAERIFEEIRQSVAALATATSSSAESMTAAMQWNSTALDSILLLAKQLEVAVETAALRGAGSPHTG